jgi:hypothetical protein
MSNLHQLTFKLAPGQTIHEGTLLLDGEPLRGVERIEFDVDTSTHLVRAVITMQTKIDVDIIADVDTVADETEPHVGSFVHFVYGDQHLNAFVIEPSHPSGGDELMVFRPNDSPFTTVAIYDPDASTTTWHWPEQGGMQQ